MKSLIQVAVDAKPTVNKDWIEKSVSLILQNTSAKVQAVEITKAVMVELLILCFEYYDDNFNFRANIS